MEVRGILEQLDAKKLQYQLRLVQEGSVRPARESCREGAYASEAEARNLTSRYSIGRQRANDVRRGKHERDGEAPTRSVVARPWLPSDGNSTKVAEGSVPMRGCYRCGQEGPRIANCTKKLGGRCNGRGHTVDGCSTSKEEAVLAVTGEDRARGDVGENGTVQASAFEAEETGEFTTLYEC